MQLRGGTYLGDCIVQLPSVDNFISILLKCRKQKNLEGARLLHAHICNNGLETHRAVGNYIVPMFVECGSVSDADHVFERLVYRNVHSWDYLMSGYIDSQQSHYALTLYHKMKEEDVLPSKYTLISLLKACASLKDAKKGREVHVEIAEKGLDTDVFIGSTLIDMYAKCGLLPEAWEVFDKLPVRNVVSWTALIAGYSGYGTGQEALECFRQMQLEGVSPNAVTFSSILKACGSIRTIDKGREIHTEILQKEFETNTFVGSSLVNMYAKCGSLLEARKVLDGLPFQNVVSWNTLIVGYVQNGYAQEALDCFQLMQLKGIFPDDNTFVWILKACGTIRAIDKGRELHMEITQKGFGTDLVVSNTLIDMYAKCGSLFEAQEFFDKMPLRDVVSWNTLIAGYIEHGFGQEALEYFQQMQLDGISPNAVTFVCCLKACASIGATEKGREIHMDIKVRGLEKELFIGNALIDMYAKIGLLSEARQIFHKLPVRDVVSWTALIAGLTEHESGQEALECYEQMQLEGISPNAITYIYTLKACCSIGALDKGRHIHTDIKQKGFERHLPVSNTLIEMYSKCGSLSEAEEIFKKLPVVDVVSWITMVNGYAMNHEIDMAVQWFEKMLEQGAEPNTIAFTCILTVCSRGGLASKGQEYFKLVTENYGIVPTIDQYTCIIDLLARSGNLYGAHKFLESIPCSLSIEIWTALLSACKIYGDTELGLRCFQQLVKMNPRSSVPYILMANIYANAGRKDDACKVEKLRKLAGAKKRSASALIEVNDKVYEFTVGSNQNKELWAMLEFLNWRMKKEGYLPNVDMILKPIPEEEKESSLCEHAEKLALAFGLLNTSHGQTLRVTKSIKMCNNCHKAGQILSNIEKREIIVQDSYCVHHFKDGLCSCTMVL